MKDEFSSIGEIVKILKGSKAPKVFDKPKPGAYPYLQIEDLRPDATPKFAIDKDGTLATKTDVLIAWDGANAGTIGFDLEGYIGSTIAILRPTRDDFHAPYLGYFLRSKFEDIQENTTGATIPHVSRDYLENLKLPLPPLTEQKRIASLLARADRLRQLRRTAHDLGDALLQSVFLEMFGDVKLNQKGWDVFPLEDIVQPGRIITYGIVQAGPHIEDGIPYIRTGDIKEGQIVVDGLLRTSKEIAAKYKRSEVKAGELVMSIRATVGTIAELPPQLDGANLTQGTARISPGSKVNKKFLLYAIRSQGTQKLIEDRVKGATFREITLEALREVPMIVPPLSLQEEFAGVVARVEQMRSQQAESERQVEGLFESLLAEAFDG